MARKLKHDYEELRKKIMAHKEQNPYASNWQVMQDLGFNKSMFTRAMYGRQERKTSKEPHYSVTTLPPDVTEKPLTKSVVTAVVLKGSRLEVSQLLKEIGV